MNVYDGLKWKLWLMFNCGFFFLKGKKDYRTGNENSTRSKRD